MTDFVRNAWYAACWSDDLKQEPLARVLLGEELALFRTGSGGVAAVEDCCPHRFAALSMGTVDAGEIVCPYHGMRFGGDGVCTAIPGQKNVPSRARMKSFPAIERNGLVWVWTGDADAAQPARLPDVHWLDAPGWRSVTGTTRYDCNWLLLVDNLIDLSHTTFVHQSTIGTDDVADTPVSAQRDGDTVVVTRMMHNTEPSKFYRQVGNFDGNVDRWHRIWLDPPSTVIIDAGAVPAGTNDRDAGIDTRVISVLTPVDDRTVDQHWGFARDFKLDDDALDGVIAEALVFTFDEDRDILARQQRNLEKRPGALMMNNVADAGVVLARRLIDEFRANETAAAE
jgi:vanillate O-demethylase monooxygenase subunit